MTERTSPLPTDDALDVLASSSAAAFAIDRHDRVVYWNRGAERLFGWTGDETLGKLCYEVLEGRDPFGNVYCTAQCPIVVAAANGEVSEPFMMHVATKSGGRETVRIRALPLPMAGEGFQCLMHLVDEDPGHDVADLVRRVKAAAAGHPHLRALPDPPISVNPLTPREREIVQMLSNGYAALNIAARLDLSHATVRNHIQNILRKLEVHSQVEAISVAFRKGWL